MLITSKGFGRLATGETIKAQSNAVKAAGGRVERDNAAGTVRAYIGDVQAFAAIRKGGAGQPWIVRYNAAFYAE